MSITESEELRSLAPNPVGGMSRLRALPSGDDRHPVFEPLGATKISLRKLRKNPLLNRIKVENHYDPVNGINATQGFGIDGPVLTVVEDGMNQHGSHRTANPFPHCRVEDAMLKAVPHLLRSPCWPGCRASHAFRATSKLRNFLCK